MPRCTAFSAVSALNLSMGRSNERHVSWHLWSRLHDRRAGRKGKLNRAVRLHAQLQGAGPLWTMPNSVDDLPVTIHFWRGPGSTGYIQSKAIARVNPNSVGQFHFEGQLDAETTVGCGRAWAAGEHKNKTW